MASNPRKGQAKCPGAKTTSHDGRAGHVMTHMCHPSKARRMASVTIQVPMQGICTPTVAYLLAWIKITSKARSRGTVRGQGSGIAHAWYDATSVVNDESIIFS